MIKNYKTQLAEIGHKNLSVRRFLFLTAALFFCTLAVVLVQRGEAMFSRILIADDQSYVVDYLMHGFRGHTLNLTYLQLMVQWFGVEGGRLFLAVATALSAAGLSAIIYIYCRNPIVALAPVFALSMPVSMSQYIFLNGSHPTAALPAVVVLLVCIVSLSFADAHRMQIASSIGAVAAGSLALFLTPMAPGLSLAALVFFCANIPMWRTQTLKLFLLFIVSISGPVVFFIGNFLNQAARNHYLDLAGWVDPSYNRVAAQLSGFVANLLSNKFLWISIAVVLILFIVIVLGNFLARRSYYRMPDKKAVLISLLFIAAGALSFAPALFVPFIQDRYYEVPAFLTVTGALIFLFSVLTPWPARLVLAATIAIALVSISVLGRVAVQGHYERITRITNQIHASLPPDLPANAQVVIVGDRLPYSGFNHWSTGFFQYLTGRNDIIGLIGPSNAIGPDDPIVGRWVRHGPDYWSTGADGRARRIRMIGLEMGRPTFGYRFDEVEGALHPTAVVAGDGSRALRAEPGGLFSPVDSASMISVMSCGAPDSVQPARSVPEIILGTMPTPSRIVRTEFIDLPAEGAAPSVVLQAGGVLEAHFHFEPVHTRYGRQEWGETYPPTPLLAQGWFQFVQLEGEYWVVNSGSDSIAHRGEDAQLSVFLVPGCGIEVRLGASVLQIYESDNDVVRMRLGQGFLQRNWEGRVRVATN